jgi:multisubunit Na+/H+ antiporter MnhF subunit
MMATMVYVCIALLAVSVLAALARIARGPLVIDRLLAFDLLTVCGVGMMALLSVLWRTEHYLELVLVFSLLGFLSTVAFTLYLNKTLPEPRERPEQPRAEDEE